MKFLINNPVEALIPFKEHCVKSVQIRSIFWSVFSRIRTEYGKIRTRKYSVFGHFWHNGGSSGPVETACTFKGSEVPMWEKVGLSPKEGIFCQAEKQRMKRLFRTYWNCIDLLEGLWRALIQKNGKTTERRGSIVKCEKIQFSFWGGGLFVKILWDSPCLRVIWKLLNTFGWILVHTRLDLLSKLQKRTPFAWSRSAGEEWKNEKVF